MCIRDRAFSLRRSCVLTVAKPSILPAFRVMAAKAKKKPRPQPSFWLLTEIKHENQSTNQYNQSRTSQPISATDQKLVNQSVQSIKNQSTNQCNRSETSQLVQLFSSYCNKSVNIIDQSMLQSISIINQSQYNQSVLYTIDQSMR